MVPIVSLQSASSDRLAGSAAIMPTRRSGASAPERSALATALHPDIPESVLFDRAF